MFSGIIEAIGEIVAIEDRAGDKRFTIDAGHLHLGDVKTGDSIAVNGVCLTVVDHADHRFVADVSAETLICTTFNLLQTGDRVNLERALKLSDRLHGHLVSGHVDGIATVRERHPEARSERFVLECPPELMKYISRKGSVCIDGVSLTVNTRQENTFTVNIIPHTLQETILSGYRPESLVNIEVDIIARYLESLLEPGQSSLSVSKL